MGNTPCVKISDAICPKGRTIYAKLEYFNPLSSAPWPRMKTLLVRKKGEKELETHPFFVTQG